MQGGNGRFRFSWQEPEGEDPTRDFPMSDEFTDFSGRKRRFKIDFDEFPLGYKVSAREVTEGEGYEFSAFSSNSPYLALGELRGKMYRELATRYLDNNGGECMPTHDTLRGRITYEARGETAPAVVIDGRKITWEHFGRMVALHEGWHFTLRFEESTSA